MLSTALHLVSLFVYPLNLSLFVAFFGLLVWLLRWKRIGFGLVFLALSWLYICSTAQFSYLLMGILERDYPAKTMAEIEHADAIVLLGGALRGDSRKGILPDMNQYADRLVHAVALYKAGKADYLLLTGGAAPGSRSEAHLMRDVMLVMGVPAEAMILEDESADTHENAVKSAKTLSDLNVNRILLVTSAFHMPRAVPLFRNQGLYVIPAPTDFGQVILDSTLPGGIPGIKNLVRTTDALHEIVGYQVYRMRGWL